MRIDRCSEQGYAELEWWQARLEREGRAALRDSCVALGRSGLERFLRQNVATIDRYLGITPARREAALKKIGDPLALHAFLLCARLRLYTACRWIDLSGRFAEDHLLGKASRDRVKQALIAQDEYLQDYPTFWPFDDGTDPLGEGLPAGDDEDDED